MTDYPRRDFLALSALGILGGVRLGDALAARADDPLLYVGTYTANGRSEGIHLVRMDPRTGALRAEGSLNAGPNPSFLAIHPNGRVLYAVNEIASGTVSAFSIDRQGTLARLNQHASAGDAPCYVTTDRRGRVVLVANYDSGTVARIDLTSDGALGESADVDRHQGKGPNAERQEGPHAHCIVPDPSDRFALAADLGIDRVVVYRIEGGRLEHVDGDDAVLKPGAGPRHIAYHPTLPLVFVANELDSTVSTLRFDREHGTLQVIGSVSTLPTGWSGSNFPADIHIDSSGRTVYVSNRGHNSIAVFSVADRPGALVPLQVVPTEGDWPRNFTIDPTERWLLVANERSGSIVVFARDDRTGRLSLTSERLALRSPVCLRFRSHVGPIT